MPSGLPSSVAPNSYDLYEEVEYQEYWTDTGKLKLDVLEHAIVREFLPSQGNRIIDLGCGYGRMADCYLDRFKTVVMLDGSRSLLKAAQKATDGMACYVLGDISRLPFRSSVFDSVLMVRVFHHLNDTLSCMESVHRILCERGRLVFNYSNKRNPLRVLKYLLGTSTHNPFSTEPMTAEANFFHHHPDYVSELLAESGFDTLSYRGAGVFDKAAEMAGPLARLVPTGTLLAPFLGKLFLAPWIFCEGHAKKGEPLQPISGVEDLFMCPRCESDLAQDSSGFECKHCRSKYPLSDGIFDMRIDSEAK